MKLHHIMKVKDVEDLLGDAGSATTGHRKSQHKPYNTKDALYKDNQARRKREKIDKKRAGVPARITARASRARSGGKR